MKIAVSTEIVSTYTTLVTKVHAKSHVSLPHYKYNSRLIREETLGEKIITNRSDM
jgi:hypothetical protein